LALRKPHLEKARADLAAADADLKQAKLDLARTRVVSPFNAIVRSERVEVGSVVTAQEALAELVGTDAYWVKASIPVDRLNWIRTPRKAGESGSPARVFHGDRQISTGRVIKLLSDLESEGRMARILVEVDDPLGLNSDQSNLTPLLIGEYVRVEIGGRELEDVYRIPRSALRDNERIWLADENGRLEIREVDTLWRDADSVLVRDGLSPGELLITSDIAAPVAGMTLTVTAPGEANSGGLARPKGEG
jgi:RND family efflux transporter MFP subunit